MNLDELNKASTDAKRFDLESAMAKSSEERFAAIRNSDRSLLTTLDEMRRYHEDDHRFIHGIIREFEAEILRVAELRKEAHGRTCRVKAQMLRKAIEAALGPQEKPEAA